MRILLIGLSYSIHTARWIAQIVDQGWDLHLFPSRDSGVIHPDLRNVTIYHSLYGKRNRGKGNVRFRGLPVISETVAFLGRGFLKTYFPKYRVIQLRRVVERVKPDIIHSMEIQAAGYLTLEAKKRFHGKFPPCIVTNWGSDIYLFGRLSKHETKIKDLLAQFDFYSCECSRDVKLARSFGFRGEVLPVFPNAGGFDLQFIEDLKQPGKTSERRSIILKGYQGWAGRSLVGIRALGRCAEILENYEILIYSASEDVEIAAELLSKSTGIPITIIPWYTPHCEMLKMFGKSRISIGLSISDAISTSLLDAIAMGSFPIQSWTSCADEWIEDDVTGILVPPEDPEVIEQAIRKALSDDDLVNRAADINSQTSRQRLDYKILKQKTIDMYEHVYSKILSC